MFSAVVCQYYIASIKLCTRERKNIGISISVREKIAHQLVGKATFLIFIN